MDVLNEALDLLEGTGPEYGPGLSNHAPMAAEALLALGRGDAVLPWVTGYRKRLEEGPPQGDPVSGGYWFGALGSMGRYADWVVLFEEELRDSDWCTVLNVWLPRLLPGIVGAAYHGAIRVGHAVRSLHREESPAKSREFVRAMAYWAARYQSLPGFPLPDIESRSPLEAIRDVEPLPGDDRLAKGLIRERIARLKGFGAFERVINLTEPPEDVTPFYLDLMETFIRVYLANATSRGNAVTFIHGVTGPGAVSLMAGCLMPDISRMAFRYAWQASAALYAAIGRSIDRSVYSGRESEEDLIARAVDTGDEHAIKFTDVCLRVHRIEPRPVFLAAARHAIDRLGPST